MFRLKIWGLSVCLALLVAEAGNAAPRAGGLPAPRGEASWLDLEALWTRAWSWLLDSEGGPKFGSSIDPDGGKHGLIIDPDGGPKHGRETDADGAPLATARAWGKHGPAIEPGRSN